MVGGPGIGKTTVGQSLASRYGFCLISTSQILRAEVANEESQRGIFIRKMMELGQNLPSDVIVTLILNQMMANPTRFGYLLIGFPREKHQALLFNNAVRRPDLVIHLTSRKAILEDRMRARALRNERFDDTTDSIRERLRTYYRHIDGALALYKNELVIINAATIVDIILTQVCKAVDEMLARKKIRRPRQPVM